MKRMLGIMMLAVTVAACCARGVDGDLPKARDVMPSTTDLPGGNYRYPWQMGRAGTFQSEAQWREKNPAPHLAAVKAAEMIRQIPDEAWAESMAQMKKLWESGLLNPSSMGGGQQSAMIEAMVKHGTKDAAAKALVEAYRGVTDSAVMEFIRIERPETLLNPQPGREPDAGGVVKLRVELQVWDPQVLTGRLDRIDVTAETLSLQVQTTRAVFEKAMRMMLAEKAEDWEEDLVEQHALDPVERARVDKILETINAYAAMRIEVEGDRPSAGDTCHLVVATRAAVLDDPQIAQGAAGVRRGKAVWQFSFEAAGTYADDIKAHVTEVLRILDERSEPFRGLDPSPPLVLP